MARLVQPAREPPAVVLEHDTQYAGLHVREARTRSRTGDQSTDRILPDDLDLESSRGVLVEWHDGEIERKHTPDVVGEVHGMPLLPRLCIARRAANHNSEPGQLGTHDGLRVDQHADLRPRAGACATREANAHERGAQKVPSAARRADWVGAKSHGVAPVAVTPGR